MAEQFTLFWHGIFSQWHACRFEVDGVTYVSAEQYMMARKAELFGDEETRVAIMQATSPKEQKALGRQVKHFVADRWNAVARDIVYQGNLAKFRQNPELREALFATTGTTLVEASPYDTIWGIGRGENDPRARNRETWNGTNWLGEVLDRVRVDLLAEFNQSDG